MRIAVVGLGSIGRRHVRVIREVYPDAEIVAVRSGIGGAVPEDAMVSVTVRTVSEALARDPIGVIIASPAPFHVDQAIEALCAGVPVLIEKPIAASLKDSRRLIEHPAIDETAFSLSAVGYVLRHQPAFEFVQEILFADKLGDFRGARVEAHSFLPAWRPGQDYKESVSALTELGGGVLRELSHEIDYVLSLFGGCQKVLGWRNQHSGIEIDAEEHVELLLQHNNNAVSSISLDFARDCPPRRELHAWFSAGVLTWSLLSNTVTVNYSEKPTTQHEFCIERDEMFTAQLSDFVQAVTKNHPPRCSLAEGINVMSVINSLERSYSSQCWETL